MPRHQRINRRSHFLGTKIRHLRKRHGLTMEDLSARCIGVNPDAAPSVSYLSMIERGKRIPSNAMLAVIATVFQKEIGWFLDDEPAGEAIIPVKGNRGGINGMPLEPSFLFSNDILQIAIPELLSQAGISGREFAHLLIRAYQEHHQNHFPDLEKAAEEIGQKQLGLTVKQLMALLQRQGIKIRWLSSSALSAQAIHSPQHGQIITSHFECPATLWLNPLLQQHQARLKYDLAVHIGHSVLHGNTIERSALYAGEGLLRSNTAISADKAPDATDILQAWRDFEARFFAGALLCPKVPFRQLLDRQGYEIDLHQKLGISPAVVMRRMTVVSPYPHWHYFDAYAPGKLKAIYRGNGIPLPWGNMRQVDDPCRHWAVFRLISATQQASTAQLSIMHVEQQPRLYCCESLPVKDLAGNHHVLCTGIDLTPAIETQFGQADELLDSLKQHCIAHGGSALLPSKLKAKLLPLAKLLNINWIQRGIDNEARLICARGAACPRQPGCYQHNKA